MKKFLSKQDFLFKAKNNEVFDISIIKHKDSNNINCGDLGRVLELLQNTIYSLALSKDSTAKSITEEIKRKSELFYSETYFNPFTVSLVSNISEIFEKDKSEMYCNLFIEMMKYTNTPKTIIIKMQKYNILTKIRFKNFIKLLVSNSLEVNARWANKYGQYNKTTTDYHNLKLSLEILEKHDRDNPKTYDYKGELVGINVKNDFFALSTFDDEFIQGKLSKAMKNQKFKVPSNVRAEIEQHTEICNLTQTLKMHYTLKNIV